MRASEGRNGNGSIRVARGGHEGFVPTANAHGSKADPACNDSRCLLDDGLSRDIAVPGVTIPELPIVAEVFLAQTGFIRADLIGGSNPVPAHSSGNLVGIAEVPVVAEYHRGQAQRRVDIHLILGAHQPERIPLENIGVTQQFPDTVKRRGVGQLRRHVISTEYIGKAGHLRRQLVKCRRDASAVLLIIEAANSRDVFDNQFGIQFVDRVADKSSPLQIVVQRAPVDFPIGNSGIFAPQDPLDPVLSVKAGRRTMCRILLCADP